MKRIQFRRWLFDILSIHLPRMKSEWMRLILSSMGKRDSIPGIQLLKGLKGKTQMFLVVSGVAVAVNNVSRKAVGESTRRWSSANLFLLLLLLLFQSILFFQLMQTASVEMRWFGRYHRLARDGWNEMILAGREQPDQTPYHQLHAWGSFWTNQIA